MRVISRKCNVGHNGERFVKGTPFEVDDETGNRLIAQGTVELYDKVVEEFKPTVNIPVVTIEPVIKDQDDKPAEEEFKKVGARWKRRKNST